MSYILSQIISEMNNNQLATKLTVLLTYRCNTHVQHDKLNKYIRTVWARLNSADFSTAWSQPARGKIKLGQICFNTIHGIQATCFDAWLLVGTIRSLPISFFFVKLVSKVVQRILIGMVANLFGFTGVIVHWIIERDVQWNVFPPVLLKVVLQMICGNRISWG